MADAPETPETPELSAEQQAVIAWHACRTLEDKRAAVAKFPKLREMYSEAQYLK